MQNPTTQKDQHVDENIVVGSLTYIGLTTHPLALQAPGSVIAAVGTWAGADSCTKGQAGNPGSPKDGTSGATGPL